MDIQQIKLDIAARAAAAGIFYQSEYFAFCSPLFDAALPGVDRYLSELDPVSHGLDGYVQKIAQAKAELAKCPRGTWVILKNHRHERTIITSVLMSIGDGQVHQCLGGKLLTYAEIYADMLKMDVYDTRLCYQRNEQTAKGQATIASKGWRPGTVLKNVKIGSKTYSTAVINEIGEYGYVFMTATRRGSPKRWDVSVLAHDIDCPDPAKSAAKAAAASPTASLF